MNKAHIISWKLAQALLAILLSSSLLYPQNSMEVGGYSLPAKGVVRVLVVFAQFKDDQTDPSSPSWRLGELPAWKDQLFATEQSAAYPKWTVSDYYAQMSMGQYHVIGDVYPHLEVTDQTAQEYANNKKAFGDINYEILSRVDKNVDFRRYDRWSGSGGAYGEKSDSIVEMVFVIYRTIPDRPYGSSTLRSALGYNWSAIALLNFSSSYRTDDGSVIQGSYPGSGVTVTNGLIYSHSKMISILAHEYGHYLLGPYHHFYSRGGLGLMGGAGPAMNAYERARLGYITVKEADTSAVQNLRDFVTTGDATRVPIDNDKYFLVENRQRHSLYDGLGKEGMDVKPYGAGIYIYRVQGSGTDNLDIESAAGNWDWRLQKWFANPWDQSMQLPLIVRSNPNPTGKDGFDAFEVNGKMYFKDFEPSPTKDTVVYTGASQGSKWDAFKIGYKEIFSPSTNPSSNRRDGSPTGIVIQLLGQDDQSIRVWFSLLGQTNVVSSVDNKSAGIPAVVDLQQNYPNPFNPSTTISFRLSRPAHVRLSVSNVLGQTVATLVDEMRQEGTHSVQWGGVNQARISVASGLYFSVLETDAERIVKRMSLIR